MLLVPSGWCEATIPTILTINRLLKIPEPEFIRETSATFKLGIQFENWTRPGDRYFHSFGDTGKGCWAGGFHHFWLRARQLGFGGEYGDYCLELKAAQAGKFGLLSDTPINYALPPRCNALWPVPAQARRVCRRQAP